MMTLPVLWLYVRYTFFSNIGTPISVSNTSNSRKRPDHVEEMSVGQAKLSHDGQTTRFESAIVKFSVRTDRELTTADLQLLDPSCATVRGGQLHIHDPQFHVVVRFQEDSDATTNSSKGQSKRRTISQLRLYDDVNDPNIENNKYYVNHDEGLYCARQNRHSGASTVIEEFIRTTPDCGSTSRGCHESVKDWYDLAVYEKEELLEQQKYDNEVCDMFGLSHSVVDAASTASAAVASTTSLTSKVSPEAKLTPSSLAKSTTAKLPSLHRTPSSDKLSPAASTSNFTEVTSTPQPTPSAPPLLASDLLLSDETAELADLATTNSALSPWSTSMSSSPPSYEDSI